MGKKTIFEYARVAAEAERRLIELLDAALYDDTVAECSETDLPQRARPRQGEGTSG